MKLMKITKLALITIMIGMVASCGQSGKKEKPGELEKELQDVGEVSGEKLAEEQKQLKKEAKQILNDYKAQMEKYEAKAVTTKREMAEKTKRVYDSLRKESEMLRARIDSIENQSARDWKEFRKEMEYDMYRLRDGVETFFEDNL